MDDVWEHCVYKRCSQKRISVRDLQHRHLSPVGLHHQPLHCERKKGIARFRLKSKFGEFV